MTAVLAEPEALEPQAQPVPAPTPARWLLGAAPRSPGIGSPGNLYFDGKQGVARFERDAAAPASEPADPTPAVRAAVERLAENRPDVAAVRLLRQKRDGLVSAVADVDGRLAELSRRHDDPKLLDREDLGDELLKISLASDALGAKRAELLRQKAALDVQMRKAFAQLGGVLADLANAEARRRDAELTQQFAAAMRKLEAAAAAPLEELWSLLQALGRRPDLKGVCGQFLHACGMVAEPVVPPAPEREGLPQRRLLPMPPHRLMETPPGRVAVSVSAVDEDDGDTE